MKHIQFNTRQVRALLDGRMTATRRAVKPPALYNIVEDEKGQCVGSQHEDENSVYCYPTVDDCPYQPGDILYVRETWSKKVSDRCKGDKSGVCPFESCETAQGPCFDEEYIYKATDNLPSYGSKWHPSTHMPKKAARLFLRVTDVHVERLRDIDADGIRAEGMTSFTAHVGDAEISRKEFANFWDSTIPKHPNKFKRYLYYWADNPWVWVIEFERISKEEAYGTTK